MLSRRMELTVGSALLAVMTATGCSLNGKWSLAEIEPTAARRDFAYSSITFQDDGTFYAEGKDVLDQDVTLSGVYTYEDDVLHLRPHEGPARTYDAELKGNELELEQFWQGQKVVAKFDRVEP